MQMIFGNLLNKAIQVAGHLLSAGTLLNPLGKKTNQMHNVFNETNEKKAKIVRPSSATHKTSDLQKLYGVNIAKYCKQRLGITRIGRQLNN